MCLVPTRRPIFPSLADNRSHGVPESNGVYFFGLIMNTIAKALAVSGLCVPLAVPLGAQWLNYPTPGIPRTPDGKPNLSAPAPRTPDGKPDFSGIWATRSNARF